MSSPSSQRQVRTAFADVPASGTWRIDAQRSSLQIGVKVGLLATVTGDPHADVVHPAPLSVAAVGRLVEVRLGASPDEAFTAACHRATGGVPFLVRELLAAVSR